MRRRRIGSALLLAGIIGLFVISWPPLDWVFSRPLEYRFPWHKPGIENVDAIVVLSGSVEPVHFGHPYPVARQDTYSRCEHGAWLFHHWKQVPVLVTGGSADPIELPFAEVMADLVQRAGVPAEMIWKETRARSTHENAIRSAVVLREHHVQTIALVTDASSMWRASASFQKQGFTVVPEISDFRQIGEFAQEALPSWKSIERNEITLHETAGLLWYRWKGWI